MRLRAFSMSHWPDGMPMAISGQCWLLKFPRWTTAAWARTASRLSGSSSRASNGTTVSHSPPMTACSLGSTPRTQPPRQRQSAPIRTRTSSKWTIIRYAWNSRGRHRFWARAFVGPLGMVLPKHLFEPYKGARSPEAPANLAPIGTGPYLFVGFKPGDLLQGRLNPNYHVENRPHFDTLEMKGGGDAVSAARAVLRTGEYDVAFDMAVEDAILKRLETGGKGRAVITPTGSGEHGSLK